MHVRPRLLLWFLLFLPACDYGNPASPSEARLSPADLQRLQSLGYEAFVEEPARPPETGVVQHDRQRAADGYVLFASRGTCAADLIDASGRTAHRWSRRDCGYWSDTALLPDGGLLVVGSSADGTAAHAEARFLRKLDWNSAIIWEAPFPAHHDVEVIPDGRLLSLSSALRQVDVDGQPRMVIDDQVVLTAGNGQVEERHSLYDLFAASPELVQLAIPDYEVDYDGGRGADAFHANSVSWVDVPALAATNPMYAHGNIVVSMRHQNTIAIVDRQARRIVWAWGRGVLDGQHSARMLPNGNILVFDNGLGRKRSRVVEIDPRTNQIVSSVEPRGVDRFYTPGGGASQRLPNGHTLVTETHQGRLMELTPTGEIVWMFLNPTHDPRYRQRATIHVSTWLASDYVQPILDRRS